MSAKKTTKKVVKKASKKVSKKVAQPPQENFGKVYINGQMAGELDGSGDGMGESFWVVLLDKKNTAEVRNNCMCGLCVGDVIEFKEHLEDDGIHHPREFVKVIKRVSEAFGLRYTFDGLEGLTSGDKFPQDCQEHLNMLAAANIRFEGVAPGAAVVSKPVEMDDDKFWNLINSGPMKFSQGD